MLYFNCKQLIYLKKDVYLLNESLKMFGDNKIYNQ
jgi:hypothetical protein